MTDSLPYGSWPYWSALVAAVLCLTVGGLAAPATAQDPLSQDVMLEAQVEDGIVQVESPGSAKTRMTVTLESSVSSEARSTAAPSSTVIIQGQATAVNNDTTVSGWSVAFAPSSFSMRFGETRNVSVIVQTSGVPRPTDVRFDINITAQVALRSGTETYYREAGVIGQAKFTPSPALFYAEGPPTIRPNEAITTTMNVANSGVYLDSYTIRAENTGPLTVTTPGSVSLESGEVQTFEIQVLGPDQILVYPNEIQIVDIVATSSNDPSASFSKPLIVTLTGFYLPVWTYPFFAMIVAAALYGGYRGVERVREDRRRYGHPGPPYTKQKKEELDALEERDPEKAALFREKLEAKYERDLDAYEERKRKGKEREVGAVVARMAAKQKEKQKTQKSAVKTIKKGKKKDKPPQEIYQGLDEDQREVLGDDLAPMLAAATPAAVALIAKDDEDKHAIDEVRAEYARAHNDRLRAEAAALAEHMREMGKDEDEIRSEMSVAQRQAAGDDLDAVLAGEADIDPEEVLDALPLLVARKGRKFLKGLRKEREKLRKKALKTIKKGKKKEWSRKKILSKLSDEQMHLVGGRLEMMLEAHFPEEVELLLLDPSEDLSKKERKRREKLQASLQKRRRKKMASAAEKIEALEEKGLDRKEVLGELSRSEKWAVEDFIDILVQPLPDAYRGLRDYLDKHDLPDKKAELWEDHLDHLRAKKVKHAKKALKTVDKGMRKGKDAREIVDDLSLLQRECLEEALRVLVKPELSKRIKGLTAYTSSADIPDEETAMWTEHVEELRERREDLRDDAVEKIKDLKADGEPPETIADELTAKEKDAVGDPIERMLAATLPEDVDVLREVARDERDADALQDARETAQEARREALSEAIDHVRKLRDGGGLLGPDPIDDVREVVDELDATEKTLLGEGVAALMRSDPVDRRGAVETYLEEADVGGVKREVWDGVLDDLDETIGEIREATVDELEDLKADDAEPDEIAEQLGDEQRSVLGDDIEAFVTAALPEDVEVLRLRTAGAEASEIKDALSDAKDARSKTRKTAIKAVKKAQSKGADLEAAVAGLPYGQRTILEDDPPETDAEGNVVEETGGLFSFGGSDDEDEDVEDEEADEDDDDGGGFSLPFGSSKPKSKKERAKELLAEGKSPAEVKEILQAEDGAEDDADEGGGGGFSLPFGGSGADDGEWKTDLTRRLIKAGVPKSEVAELLREAEDRVGDLSGDDLDDALDDFVDEVEDRRS